MVLHVAPFSSLVVCPLTHGTKRNGPERNGTDRNETKRNGTKRTEQSVGQIIGDVLKQLDNDRFIVKASSGPRYVVGCRNKLDKAALKPGTRVSLDMTTLTIMRKLPREVCSFGYGCGCEQAALSWGGHGAECCTVLVLWW